MRHRRCFTNTSTQQVLELFFSLRFCGKGGLMEDSTATSEEESSERNSRFVRNFKPMGKSWASLVAGSFHVQEELLDEHETPTGVVAAIRMTFSPPTPKDTRPTGSFLWRIEPDAVGAGWTELINTPETSAMGFPPLLVKPGSGFFVRLGHNRLMEKMAQRIARALNEHAEA